MALVVVYVVISFSFFMIRLMPGGAVPAMKAQLQQQGGLTPQEIEQKINAIYGVISQAALWKQYFSYISHVLQGNLGRPVTNPGVTVIHVVANALPWTVFSVALALIISFIIGIAIGAFMAAFTNNITSKILTFLSSFMSSIPNYLIAIVLLYVLADMHHVFPLGGAYSVNVTIGFNLPFIGSVLDHAILPIAAYVLTSFGSWALTMKGTAVSVLGQDYVRAAESWGLSGRRITQSYIGRNSMLPQVTSLALSIGLMFGGSVFVETYFTYPGIGNLMIQAVDSRDYSLMMGCFLLITVSVVICNFLVDLLYPLVDPRIAGAASAKRPTRRSRSRLSGAARLLKVPGLHR